MNKKRIPLYDIHKDLGDRFFDFEGWDMSVEYEGLTKEHNMARENARLFEVSHIGEVKIMDIAKKLLDYGYHPPKVYFPLIIKEALMIEPTES